MHSPRLSTGREEIDYIPLVCESDIDGGLSLFLKNEAGFMNLRCYIPMDPSKHILGAEGIFEPGVYVGMSARNDVLFDGGWHHVAFSYNGLDRCLKLYVDGRLVIQRYDRSLPVSIQGSKLLRFFDATSDFDTDNRDNLLIENSGQLENNAIPRRDLANTRYVGLADNIRVTAAAVPASRLGYYTDGFSEQINRED